MLYIASDNKIRLKRKNKWFCEARRHAGTYSHGDQDTVREVGDRHEVVVFNDVELEELYANNYGACRKDFTNNRVKDRARVLAKHLQNRGYYPM